MTRTGYDQASPAGQILQYIQRHGEATVKALQALLDVSATAVREHLAHLQADGLLAARSVRRGPGRPHLVYTLTAKAHSLFPKQYDQLITLLLRELSDRDGPHELEQLLDRISRRLAHEYADRMAGTDVAARLDELRRLLEQRGVPAEVPPDGESIHLFACPYHDVAHAHPEVCSMERQMIEYVLGEKLVLEQSIREGSHRCRFSLRLEDRGLNVRDAN
jgi:DeoR family suf operon transcriptional repressor